MDNIGSSVKAAGSSLQWSRGARPRMDVYRDPTRFHLFVGFNGAAALGRGWTPTGPPWGRAKGCFNGAAALGRGWTTTILAGGPGSASFNGAAALGRGWT